MIDLIITTLIILFLILTLYTKIELFFFINFLSLFIDSISLNNYTNQVSFNVLGISLAVQDLFFLSQMIFISIFLLRKIFAGKFFPHLSYFRISFLLFSFLVLKILFAFPSQGTMAFLEGKHLLYFFGNILFFTFARLENKRIKNIMNLVLCFAFLFSFVAIFRFLGILPHHLSVQEMGWEDTYNAMRYLNRSDLMYLVIGSFFLFNMMVNVKKITVNSLFYGLSFLFVSFLILTSQTRSVVMVFLLSIIFYFLINSSLNFKMIIRTFLILIPFALFSLVLDSSIIQKYFSSFSYQDLFGANSTLVFRNVISLAYLQNMNFQSYFFGMTIADTPIVFENLYFSSLNAGKVGLHNFFVECIYYFGIPASIFMIYCYYNIFIRLIKIRKITKNLFLADTLLLSIFAYFVFYLAWSPDILNGIILGLSINMINNEEGVQ